MAQRARGLAAVAVACGLAAGGVALARGLNMGPPIFGQTGGFGGGFGGGFSSAPEEYARPRVHERHWPRRRVVAANYGKPVCVRLCDGFFFPANSTAGGEAACAAQCPDAPTALYTMPGDNIDDAVSTTGAPYSKLPVARRYQTSFESTCSCHREVAASHAEQLLRDTTLRRGDVVMTAEGFRVYVGDAYGPSGPGDFVALSQARLPQAERVELGEMEHAAAGSPARAAPALVARRPKGKVTVDDGARSLRLRSRAGG